MKPAIFPISADYPGQLFIMPKPSADHLQECIEHYRSDGVTTLISLLALAETKDLSLEDERAICEGEQVDFINLPIDDFGLPDREGFKSLIRDVSRRLRNNEGVAIHCRAGIGRSGMLTCCTLAGFLGSAQEAIDIVSQARGEAVPDTIEQHAFIIDIVQDMQTNL